MDSSKQPEDNTLPENGSDEAGDIRGRVIMSEPAEFHQGAEPGVWQATLVIPPKMAADIEAQAEKEREYQRQVAKRWHDLCAGVPVARDAALKEAVESVKEMDTEGSLYSVWFQAELAMRNVRYLLPKVPVGELTEERIANYTAHLEMQSQLEGLLARQERDEAAGLTPNPMLAQDIDAINTVLNDPKYLSKYTEAGFAFMAEAKKGTLQPVKPEENPKFCMLHEAFKQTGVFDRLGAVTAVPENHDPAGKAYMIDAPNDHQVRVIFTTEDARKKCTGWEVAVLGAYNLLNPSAKAEARVSEHNPNEIVVHVEGGAATKLADAIHTGLKTMSQAGASVPQPKTALEDVSVSR